MDRLTENKIVLVVRETRLEELKARFNTVSQARFYVQQMGGSFEEYEQEDLIYQLAVAHARQDLGFMGRVQEVQRAFVPNFIFGPQDTVVALGQDGLVANTLKYLNGQVLIGVNPDPKRYDGLLLPFRVEDLPAIVPEVFRGGRPTKAVTMAKATLNNGQALYAVNDLFIGPKSHGSARYTIRYCDRPERQSSSGVIVSTGLGSTGWFSSLIAGARGVAAAFSGNVEDGGRRAEGGGQRSEVGGRKSACRVVALGRRREDGGQTTEGRLDSVVAEPAKPFVALEDEYARAKRLARSATTDAQFPWDADQLCFTVREPFPSRTTGVSVVFGYVSQERALSIESHMPERGVIFSDGMESDFLEFNSGTRAEIAVAERKGILVV